ncbi:hypothetical protein HDU97_002726 [Phlyctochytrium planicorne]|nr:hypothetical protein HDU97_002726 [Phlyctochytrium planicorne]
MLPPQGSAGAFGKGVELVKTYVPKYIRSLTCPDDGLESGETQTEAFDRMMLSIKTGIPFIQEEDMVLSMIDISGYSKVASALAVLGKFSSELLAQNLMSVVDNFSGDVIKFLGDAILVTFTRIGEESIERVALRAAACCSRCLIEHRYYKIKLEEKLRRSSLANKDEELAKSTDLRLSLHIGILLGRFQHIIVGDWHHRLEYCINGDALSDLSSLMDGTTAAINVEEGEMAMNNAVAKAIKSFVDWPERFSDHVHNSLNFEVLNIEYHHDAFHSIGTYFHQPRKPSKLEARKDRNDSVITTSSVLHEWDSSAMQFASSNAKYSSFDYRAKLSSMYEGLPDPLCRFVNTSLLSRLATTGPSNFRADYRRISVLFAKLKGKFHVGKSQEIIVAFMESVTACTGVFQHFSIDDKGQNLLAFFGLPPFAHENSALFAVKAAVGFEKHFKGAKTGLPSISVGTGDCLNELIGTSERKEIFVMGDFINVAARLLSIQSELAHIMLDNDTKELISKDFACVHVGNVKLKGKENAIAVWGLPGGVTNLRQASVRAKPPTEYIGYQTETTRLLDGYFSWKSTKESFWAVVQGESGTGKSSLMLKLSNEIKNNGSQLLVARGSEVEQLTTYFGIQPILCYILRIATKNSYGILRSSSLHQSATLPRKRSDSVATGSSKLTSLGKGKDYSLQDFESLLVECGENPIYAPLLAETLPWLKFPCVEAVEKLSIPAKNRIVSSIFLKLLSSFIGKEDCVLVIDDAQWIDSVSVGIFEQLALSQASFCCLVFSRPIDETTENGLQKIVALPTVSNLQLYGLGMNDAVLLMARILKVYRVDDEIANGRSTEARRTNQMLAIFSSTNGNVIQVQMICESVSSLRNSLFDEPANCRGVKDPGLLESIVLGSSVTIISSQLDRLLPEFQKLLKYSSILGQYFSLDDVAYLCQPEEISSDSLVKLIEENDQFQYLNFRPLNEAEDIADNKILCNFRHIRIMHAIYESISVAERTALHQRVAELYEQIVTEDPTSRKQLLPSLHHHHSKTSNVEKMVAFGEECGDIHFDAGYFKEASVYFSKCVDYWEKLGKGTLPKYQDGRILSKFAYCLAFPLTSLERGVQIAVEALKLAGEAWIADETQIVGMLKKDLVRFAKFWMRSKQGRKEIRFTKKVDKSLYRDWYPKIRYSFFALNTAALCDGSMKVELKVLILLKSLIFALTEAESNTDEIFSILYCFIYGLVNNPSKPGIWLARYFSKRAKRVLPKCAKSIVDKYMLYGAAEMYMDNNPESSIRAFQEFLEYSIETSKLTNIVRSFVWGWGANMCKGNLDIPTVYKQPQLKELIREDPVWMCVSMYGPMTCAFMTGNCELFSEYLNFHRSVIKIIPEKSLALIQVHCSLFELMGQIMLSSPEETIIEVLGRTFKECNPFMAREPDVSFSYSLVFCVLSIPNRMTERLKELMREGVASKIDMYRANSVQGHFSNFNYFMIQAAGFQLGICKPPTTFARFLRSRQPEWKEGGCFQFLEVLGHAILAVHLPRLKPKSVAVEDIATRLHKYGAVLLELWVRSISPTLRNE